MNTFFITIFLFFLFDSLWKKLGIYRHRSDKSLRRTARSSNYLIGQSVLTKNTTFQYVLIFFNSFWKLRPLLRTLLLSSQPPKLVVFVIYLYAGFWVKIHLNAGFWVKIYLYAGFWVKIYLYAGFWVKI